MYQVTLEPFRDLDHEAYLYTSDGLITVIATVWVDDTPHTATSAGRLFPEVLALCVRAIAAEVGW